MGYNNDDTWEMYGREFSTEARTLSDLKNYLLNIYKLLM